jgi:subfamily B ATP-binding cassette protein MsbA
VLKKTLDFLNEFLRINAMRRLLAISDLRAVELTWLAVLAILFAIFEGIGLSLLLPILQYADGGQASALQSSGFLWQGLSKLMDAFNLPVTLPVLLVLAFIPILLRQAVFYVNAWYSAVVVTRVGLRLRMQTFQAVLAADPAFFTRHPVGHLVGVVLGQTAIATNAIQAVIKQLSLALLLLVYVIILLALSLPLTISILFFAVIVYVAVHFNIKHIRSYGEVTARVTQEVWITLVERLGLIRLIKLRDQRDSESERVNGFLTRLRTVDIKQARLAANIEITADPLLMLSVFVTLYIGIAYLGTTLPQLGLLLFVLSRLNVKVKEFNAGRQMISQNMAGLMMVNELGIDAAAADTIHRGALSFPGLQRELVLKDVTFEYPDQGAGDGAESRDGPVLKGISLAIPAGSFTALVGRSGTGKSTLVELLPRLRDVSGGSIRYDGTDIGAFDVGTLRRGIGYLTQDAMLFNDTVRGNLVYGLGFEPSDEQIKSALEGAHAGFVYDLPQGVETMLGDRGVRFSGGEQQRIALARVLLEDTSILILDEPTSALDSESERFIQDALANLHGRKTIIVIAHRLATVIEADQLLVIEDGRIVERGTHHELVARGGAYQKLFKSQLLG